MTETNLFELAAREKYRFPAGIGEITAEQLFDLPLSKPGSRNDLNSVAIALDALLTNTAKSFVNKKINSHQSHLENKLEIVKHIIAVKEAEEDAKKDQAAKKARKEKILAALADLEEGEIKKKSKDELLAELQNL